MKTSWTHQDVLVVALLEATPKGFEPVVKALKKSPSVDNPWAMAYSMKNKGVKPKAKKKGKEDESEQLEPGRPAEMVKQLQKKRNHYGAPTGTK